ncbi:MAG: IS1595 family transposase [Limnothrix sp.]
MLNQANDDCLILLEKIRWQGEPKCPYCGSRNATAYQNGRRYHCNACYTSYSVTVGTLFHKTHVGLDKWFDAIHLVLCTQREITVRALAKEIRVNKNTASSMKRKIYLARNTNDILISKIVEALSNGKFE